jgi:hypothetical protein
MKNEISIVKWRRLPTGASRDQGNVSKRQKTSFSPNCSHLEFQVVVVNDPGYVTPFQGASHKVIVIA